MKNLVLTLMLVCGLSAFAEEHKCSFSSKTYHYDLSGNFLNITEGKTEDFDATIGNSFELQVRDNAGVVLGYINGFIAKKVGAEPNVFEVTVNYAVENLLGTVSLAMSQDASTGMATSQSPRMEIGGESRFADVSVTCNK